ncbi:MAG: adenylate/guanylate cyclase domain-containing protein, partial [Myxococcota bacterium]
MVDNKARLLVADDNKVNRLLLSRNLELQGHQVTLAENGQIALEKLQQEPFDLVLLDMEMPVMTGFEVLAHLQSTASLRDIPVIVTSSLEGEAHVVRCLELGAEDVLKKPINAVILRARVNSSLEKKRLRDQQKALISRFAANEVAQDLERSGFALRGQRITVTVMFVDLRGFTTMSEQHSPEEIIELLNTYYTLMFEAIGSHGGVVNQIIGDGLMALFGAPRPLEDAALRAMHCAQEMLEMLDLLNAERELTGATPLRIGVGVATGDVV